MSPKLTTHECISAIHGGFLRFGPPKNGWFITRVTRIDWCWMIWGYPQLKKIESTGLAPWQRHGKVQSETTPHFFRVCGGSDLWYRNCWFQSLWMSDSWVAQKLIAARPMELPGNSSIPAPCERAHRQHVAVGQSNQPMVNNCWWMVHNAGDYCTTVE